MKQVRCAIYTRKSSDEGLEQDFNSLDAQREACAAYILSQTSEGWTALSERYDDGGISGGTLERPALRRLLADIAAGKIDIIVVYKVDRLTRSLLDFSRLVETFDKHDTSFVSITQSFNTTSSMGRLTLNMLLSFAQFEREVTAERIRDKIAASKAKGMWMGGTPPIGYRPDGRSLAIVDEDAGLVRDIFRRYLEIRNVRLLTEQLERDRILTPARLTATGKRFGGVSFSRGQIYKLLSCPTYVGDVVHQGKTFAGLHTAIVARDVWEQAQQILASNTRGEGKRTRRPTASLLAGKVTDSCGEPLVPVHSTKGQRRYRYYVSSALQHGKARQGLRVPARELEKLVVDRLAQAFDDPLQLMVDADLMPQPDQIGVLDETGRAQAALLRSGQRELCDRLVAAVRIERAGVGIDCDRAQLADVLGLSHNGGAEMLTLVSDAQLSRSGLAMRLVQGERASGPESSLIRLLGKANLYWRELRLGQLDIKRLAERENISAPYITRVLRLAFLSPRVVEAILSGKQKRGITMLSLFSDGSVTSPWEEQERALISH
jgi:site-specific DNA recombinase